jgi:F0F1-type ATP synthase assembly protein I
VTALFSFLLGGGLTVLPDVYFMAMAFDSFWFSNMGYHMLRSNFSLAHSLKQKHTIFKTIIGWRSTSKFTGLQYPLVLIVGLLAPVLMWKRGKQVDLAFYIVLVLILTSLLPSPSYVQYFCVTVPFLLLGVVWALREIVRLRGSIRMLTGAICICSLFHYFRVVPLDVHKYTVSGRGVLSFLGPKESKTLSAMRRVASAVDSVTEPGDRVLTMWPGVLVGSHARPYRRLENHFGLKEGHKVLKAHRENFM